MTNEKSHIIIDVLASVAKEYCSPYDVLPLVSWLLLTNDLRPLLTSIDAWNPIDGHVSQRSNIYIHRYVVFCNRAESESLCNKIAMKRPIKYTIDPFRSFNDIVHSDVSPKCNNLHVTWIDTSMLAYLAISTIDLPSDYNLSFMSITVLFEAVNILFRDRLPQPKYIT